MRPIKGFLFATVLLVLLAGQASAQLPDEKTRAYWEAARSGNIENLKQQIADGIDLDVVTEFNCGAMYFAANKNQADVIKLLAEAGANVNLRDTDYGFTPVQMAAWLGHAEATEALIEAGATPKDVIGSGFAAASNGHAETVAIISKKMELKKGQLNAMWNTAKNTGHENVCKVLEDLGATPPNSEPERKTESTETEKPETAESKPESKIFDFESDQALPVAKAVNWPAFRGLNRAGNADGQHPPAGFDIDGNRNIKWQAAVPGLGLSSPVIWNGKVYITTATSELTKQSVKDEGIGWIASVPEDVPHEWQVLCFDLESGSLLWQKTAFTGKPKSERHWKASQANSTCAVDGENLIACFGSEGLFCFDLDGNQKWRKDLGDLTNGWYIDSTFPWGFASSPIIYQDLVIVQCDVYGGPFVAAYRISDGEQVWKATREGELSSWGTPTIVAAPNRDELVTNASKAVRSYDPKTGNLLWQIKGNSTITVASPVADDGLIVATGGYKTPKPIYVVRAGTGEGDITPEPDGDSESVAWSRQNGGTYIVTPLMYRGLLYMCKLNGVLSVYDPKTGEEKYKQRLKTGAITASPVAADGKIYFVGENGKVVVITAGDTHEQISENDLGESALATPAISNGTIVFRTVKGLVAIAHNKAQP